MKKLLSILLALAMIFSVAACSSKEEAPAEEPTPAEETSEETAEETAEETGEEGQNPVMNLVGDYASDRCTITVEAGEGKTALFTIDWASSAAERSEWTMSGEFDEETNSVYYQDCTKKNLVFAEDGSVSSEETVYEGGHGTFTFNADEQTLTWTDDIENIADGAVFTYIPR